MALVAGLAGSFVGGLIFSLIAGDGRVFAHWDILKADPSDFRLLAADAGGAVGEGPIQERFRSQLPDPMVPLIGGNLKIRMLDGT